MPTGSSSMSERDAAEGLALRERAVPGFADCDGLRVHYRLLRPEAAGTAPPDGPVWVLVHGAGCDMSFWDLQLVALLSRAPVLLVDLPGHGASDCPRDRRYSMRFYAQGVAAALRDCAIERAVLVGHSMGVNVVRELYRANPAAVSGLVAISGILVYEPLGRAFATIRRLTATPAWRLLWPPWVRRLVGRETPDWAREKVLGAMLSAPPFLVRSYLYEMLHAETAYNDAIRVPVLSLLARDHRGSAAARAALQQLNDASRVVVLPGVSHFLQLDDPATTNRLLLEFFDEVAGR
jgi:pimeloyl-ACP methyl ester carboxylesterase